MPRFRFSLFALVLVALLLSGSAVANAAMPAAPPATIAPLPADPYTIHGVKVDVKAANANQARDKAFNEGQRQAFKLLAKNLALDPAFDTKTVDDATLGNLLKSFEVEEEQASGVRYIASLTFHFKPAETADLFEKHAGGVKAVDSPTPSATQSTLALAETPRTLIVPVLHTPTRDVLWEEETPWFQAWDEAVRESHLAAYVLPESSVEDVSTITAAEAMAGSRAPLLALLQRYHANALWLVVLNAPTNFAATALAPTQALSGQFIRYDKTGMVQENSPLPLADSASKQPLLAWLKATVSPILTARAAAAPIQATQSLTPPPPKPPEQTLTIAIPFTATSSWIQQRAVLAQIPSITHIDLLSMSRRKAVARLGFQGSRQALEDALLARQLELVPSPPGASGTMLQLQPTNTPPPEAVFENTSPEASPDSPEDGKAQE